MQASTSGHVASFTMEFHFCHLSIALRNRSRHGFPPNTVQHFAAAQRYSTLETAFAAYTCRGIGRQPVMRCMQHAPLSLDTCSHSPFLECYPFKPFEPLLPLFYPNEDQLRRHLAVHTVARTSVDDARAMVLLRNCHCTAQFIVANTDACVRVAVVVATDTRLAHCES